LSGIQWSVWLGLLKSTVIWSAQRVICPHQLVPPPAGDRRRRDDVVFTETGKLPVKFDYRLRGTVIR